MQQNMRSWIDQWNNWITERWNEGGTEWQTEQTLINPLQRVLHVTLASLTNYFWDKDILLVQVRIHMVYFNVKKTASLKDTIYQYSSDKTETEILYTIAEWWTKS